MKNLNPSIANEIKNLYHKNAVDLQHKLLNNLLSKSQNTIFGKEHNFKNIKSPEDFKKYVPIREYKDFNKYLSMVFIKQPDVLIPGLHDYLITTSASTGTKKYVPMTIESLQNNMAISQKLMMQYIYDNNNDYSFLSGNIFALASKPVLKIENSYLSGYLSSVMRNIQKANTLPSKEVLSIDNWQQMLETAAKEIKNTNISTCIGLPSWLAQFFKTCCEIYDTDNLSNIFPKLKLLSVAGTNYRPYIKQFENLFEQRIDFRETYGGSEGLYAYQDCNEDVGMLLAVNDGIYFEFIPFENINKNNPHRLNLAEVEINKPYALVITNSSGLWAYKVGDIIEFTSVSPYRIKVVGRIQQFINIAGEHVYSEQVEQAIRLFTDKIGIDIAEFTVMPSEYKQSEISYYDWFIECNNYQKLQNISKTKSLEKILDECLMQSSFGYKNIRSKNALSQSRINFVKSKSFINYLDKKNKGNLQQKVPKLQNNRDIASQLELHK